MRILETIDPIYFPEEILQELEGEGDPEIASVVSYLVALRPLVNETRNFGFTINLATAALHIVEKPLAEREAKISATAKAYCELFGVDESRLHTTLELIVALAEPPYSTYDVPYLPSDQLFAPDMQTRAVASL